MKSSKSQRNVEWKYDIGKKYNGTPQGIFKVPQGFIGDKKVVYSNLAPDSYNFLNKPRKFQQKNQKLNNEDIIRHSVELLHQKSYHSQR